MQQQGRVYGGRSVSERRAERRTRLLSAGFELFGTEGWQAATIERLCSQAGVATRSFYEEFASRELLLQTIYEGLLEQVVEVVRQRVLAANGTAARVREGLVGYVEFLVEDPRRVRIVHREIRLAGALQSQRHAMLVRFGELIGEVAGLSRGHEARVLGVALAGSVSEVLVDWVEQPEPRPPLEPSVEVLVRLYLAALPV